MSVVAHFAYHLVCNVASSYNVCADCFNCRLDIGQTLTVTHTATLSLLTMPVETVDPVNPVDPVETGEPVGWKRIYLSGITQLTVTAKPNCATLGTTLTPSLGARLGDRLGVRLGDRLGARLGARLGDPRWVSGLAKRVAFLPSNQVGHVRVKQ